MLRCDKCGHLPSARCDHWGRQCYCPCHDEADKAVEKLRIANNALHQIALSPEVCSRQRATEALEQEKKV